MLALIFITIAHSVQPVVAAGNGLVAAPPPELVKPASEVASTWISVLGDCLEDGRPGAFSVVDRSDEGTTTSRVNKDVGSIRELEPAAVVLGLGALEMSSDEEPAAFRRRLTEVVSSLRAGNGPLVLLVGIVGPTLSQLEWSAEEDVAARQGAIDQRARSWNEALERVAASDDGVWRVDLAWPSDSSSRKRLTRGGWALTDRAHARVGAVICEELLKKLKNHSQ